MALAFDAAAGSSISGTSLTYAHTCSGSDRLLVVSVSANGSSGDQITGVTYNGVAMTRKIAHNVSTDFWVYIYTLIAPATGANNIVISGAASFVIRGASASYNVANQSSQVDATGTGSANPGTSVTAPVTVLNTNCWLVGAVHNDGAGVETPAGALVTKRTTDGNNVLSIGDSNGIVTHGLKNATWTSSSQKLVACAVSIKATDSALPSEGGAFLYNLV